MYSKD